MHTIVKQRVRFISRGDDSGTHKKETALWRLLNFSPADFEQDWYISSGGGMGQVIVMADQLRAYTLSDIGTFLFFAGERIWRFCRTTNRSWPTYTVSCASIPNVIPKPKRLWLSALLIGCWPNERKKESANTACWAILCLFPPSNRASCGN